MCIGIYAYIVIGLSTETLLSPPLPPIITTIILLFVFVTIIIIIIIISSSSINIICDCQAARALQARPTPGLHNKIPAHKIFARVWVAQESFVSQVVAKIFQGLRPKRRKYSNGDWVYIMCFIHNYYLCFIHNNILLSNVLNIFYTKQYTLLLNNICHMSYTQCTLYVIHNYYYHHYYYYHYSVYS